MHERLLETLNRSGKLFADETTAPVLDPGPGRTKIGQLWADARDDRPWGGSDPPGVAYVYAPDRTGGRPIAHLAGFEGVLQLDRYSAYGVLAKGGAVRPALLKPCPSSFYELAAASPIATEALARIAALYRV
ncbi:IS66 family transposase [Methylobacterium sp. C25]|uniref:IS66 family transposase n=1 Tax=Methylobacterium sp. C25 TaxID=2721622 RepID=UPI003FA394BF